MSLLIYNCMYDILLAVLGVHSRAMNFNLAMTRCSFKNSLSKFSTIILLILYCLYHFNTKCKIIDALCNY